MHTEHVKRITVRLRIFVAMFGALAIMGCGSSSSHDDNDFTDVTPADLALQAFTFADPFDDDDDRAGQSGTVTVGSFSADGDDNPNTAVYSVVADDGSTSSGTLTVGSCIITTTFVALIGEAPEAVDAPPDELDPCSIDGDGRLRLRDEEGDTFVSEPGTAAQVLLDLSIDVSPANEVPSLAGRPETGTVTLRLLSGHILEYTATVTNLTPSDTLTDMHIHPGSAMENQGVFLTLVNEPVQAGRTSNITFDSGTSITASIVLTADEVAQLTNANNPFYVNIHSTQVPTGLLRGQLRD